ncbi:hypothetical protein EYF80_065954 [Liparis tanakae]|uniref:Uncharacterized protein n=1 Tax=Liparis tanakae TaxID=230148 RepID=A0A4Z2E5J7_9TELE|nr:hypothetical protein EYF80_065954 [Liparis tanakae]
MDLQADDESLMLSNSCPLYPRAAIVHEDISTRCTLGEEIVQELEVRTPLRVLDVCLTK